MWPNDPRGPGHSSTSDMPLRCLSRLRVEKISVIPQTRNMDRHLLQYWATFGEVLSSLNEFTPCVQFKSSRGKPNVSFIITAQYFCNYACSNYTRCCTPMINETSGISTSNARGIPTVVGQRWHSTRNYYSQNDLKCIHSPVSYSSFVVLGPSSVGCQAVEVDRWIIWLPSRTGRHDNSNNSSTQLAWSGTRRKIRESIAK